MNTKPFSSCAAAWVASVVFATGAFAEDTVVRTTTTSSAGAIEQFVPNSEIVLRSETTSAPVRYSVTRETQFVDDAGAPVAVERITSGAPVNVEYVRQGDRMIVSRVVVRNVAPVAVERRTTTTTTTQRELSHREKEQLEKMREAEKDHAEKVREADKERAEEFRKAREDD